MHRLLLASASPRRRELLERAGFLFTVFPLKVSETPDKNLNVNEQILGIASQKARAAFERLQKTESSPYVVLSADTEVVLDDELLGKPDSPEAAMKMLRRLSGREHFVKTAVWLVEGPSGRAVSHLETTVVRLKSLTDEEIRDYVATGEPMDKAGSYGIQGLGRALVASLEGDFDNVVGLPVKAVEKMFFREGWDLPQNPRGKILREVRDACERAGRDPKAVKILAVSKLQPVEKIRALAAQGQREFGENYVQELVQKKTELPDPELRWHLIGHLQKNKIKFISGTCALIHSVDSLELARALGKKAAENSATENILFQINLADESSKEGFSREGFLKLWPELAALPGIRIHGLMTMPPLQNEAAANRVFFRDLRQLLETLRENSYGHPLSELSMGTSHDFPIAIEEGATIVRLGTVLFGPRY